ncbi:MAG: hypothetical protein V7K48_27125 [Nostoc sp.]
MVHGGAAGRVCGIFWKGKVNDIQSSEIHWVEQTLPWPVSSNGGKAVNELVLPCLRSVRKTARWSDLPGERGCFCSGSMSA